MLDQAHTIDPDGDLCEVGIRAAMPEDLPAIIRLLAPFRPAPETARLGETVAGLLQAYGSAVLVAATPGPLPELVGLAVLAERRIPPTLGRPGRRFVEIEQLVVIASHRDQGVGSRLIAAAERWAAGRGHAALELTVAEQDSDAARLYGSSGFAPATRRLTKAVALA